MTTDEALMLEFRAGRRAAFDELFDRYRQPLYGFFRRRWTVPTGRTIWRRKPSWR
jgi:hypothetical protein